MINNIKHIIIIIITLNLFFFDCFAQQQTINNEVDIYPKDIGRIIEQKEIRVGIKKGDIPPFLYTNKEGTERYGIDINIANSIAKAFGVKPNFEHTADSFNGVINLVINGEVDIAISKLSVTEERNKKVLFTKPYAIFNHGLLINRKAWQKIKNKNISTTKALQDGLLKLGILSDSSYVFFAQNILKAKNIDSSCNDWEKLMQKLIVNDNDIDAIYRDIFEIKKILTEKYELIVDYATLSFDNLDDRIAIAVNYKDRHLKYWLDSFLTNYLSRDMYIKKAMTKKKQHCQKIVYKMVNKKNFEDVWMEFCSDNYIGFYDAETVIHILKDINLQKNSNFISN